MQKVLEGIRHVMKVQGSSVYEINPDQSLSFSFISGPGSIMSDIGDIRLQPGQGIVGRVVETGEPIIANDVSVDPYFCDLGDKKTGFRTKQVLCVPLKVYNKTIGALQAVNTVEGTDFTRQDVIIFKAFASQVAVALEHARLYDKAVVDGLTGIHNRAFFTAWAATEVARAFRVGKPLSIALFDVDFFKKFNDTFGHEAGDVVLQTVAGLVQSSIRKSDVWARWGGEEFILALPDTDGTEAAQIVENLRIQVGNHNAEYEGRQLRITVSAGMSTYDTTRPANLEDIVKEADKALYMSKSGGRNRVTLFPGTKGE